MVNFYDRVETAAARFPDRPAIEVQRAVALESVTYRTLRREAERISAWLTRRGITRGDRCAILADNDAPWVEAYLGVLRIGGVAVPLDTAYKSHQVHAVIESCAPRVIFTTPRYAETVTAAIALSSTPPEIVLLHDTRGDADGDDLRSAEADRDIPPVANVAAADPAVLLYTSGTTSDPKGVILTHGNLDAERAAAFTVIDVSERDAVLGVLPLFHALAQMANLLLPLVAGARVVFLETVSSSALLSALEDRGITIFACVPQFFYLIHQRVVAEIRGSNAVRRAVFQLLLGTNGWLRDHVGWNPGRRWFARVHRALGSKMRIFVTGGSKFDPAIGRDLYDLGFTLLNAYGLTETSGGATMVRVHDRYSTSVGQAFPGVELRIAPRESNETADADRGATDGEILIRGPIVMSGYFRRPDATAEALVDGWLQTGDLGYLDREGRLYITGRKKEIIVLASGKNLYPEEIEAHYRQSPFIKELCVLGLARMGTPAAERLHGVIVPDEQYLRDRGVVNVREIVRFEVESWSVDLPAHKRILTYDIWLEPLPRTTTGKLKRHEIERRVRERAAAPDAGAEPTISDADRAWLEEDGHAAQLAIIARRLDRPHVHPGANLDLDLGLDSMERVEILTELELHAGRRVSPEQRAAIFTVRQLVDAVQAGEPAARIAGTDATAWDTLLTRPIDPAVAVELGKRKTGRAVVCFVVLKAARLVARVIVGFRATGQSHLPRTPPFIISPNHQSYLDGFFLVAALPFRTFRRLFFVGAAEYFDTRVMAWLARAVNIVPVDPDANLVSAMQIGAAGLRLNRVLILFPEGERSIDGELKPFRKGAAILASRLHAPIVPVALDGLYAIWPRRRPVNWGALVPGRGVLVRLAFGAPIVVRDHAEADGTAALEHAVAEMFGGLRASAQGTGQRAKGKS